MNRDRPRRKKGVTNAHLSERGVKGGAVVRDGRERHVPGGDVGRHCATAMSVV